MQKKRTQKNVVPEGYTSQEMINWYSENEMQYQKPHITSKRKSGLYKEGALVIIHLKEGVLHNPSGPAKIVIGKHTKTPLRKEYYLEGKQYPPDDIAIKMIQARENRNYECQLWL